MTDKLLSVHLLEASAVVLACGLFQSEHLNIVTDSMFVARLCQVMSGPGISTSHAAIIIEEALSSRQGTISVIHVNSHNPIKGFFQISNNKADAAAKGLWTLQDAQQLHEVLHVRAKALAKKCSILIADARHIVASCPHCQKVSLWSSGVNPRGLKASEIWQSDFTLCQLLKPRVWLAVTVDTYSGMSIATRHAKANSKATIQHWVVVVPRILCYSDNDVLPHLEENPLRQKRELIITISLTVLLGLGAMGTATGVSALVSRNQGLAQLQTTVDEDLRRIQKTISDLEESVDSLAEVALQNRRRLDLLLMHQGAFRKLPAECRTSLRDDIKSEAILLRSTHHRRTMGGLTTRLNSSKDSSPRPSDLTYGAIQAGMKHQLVSALTIHFVDECLFRIPTGKYGPPDGPRGITTEDLAPLFNLLHGSKDLDLLLTPEARESIQKLQEAPSSRQAHWYELSLPFQFTILEENYRKLQKNFQAGIVPSETLK
ncbi:hypothetical protein TURU_169361 [Turdus rufiventris]|nr:hypothetical protein TURU_169361 [Turdus rufiventris]